MNPITPPYFSVITTVRNRRQTIERCITSVIRQKFSNFEYIIIDAMSDDGTSELVERFRLTDNRITYVREPDSGIYSALNKAIRLATGRYVCVVHSDDLLPDDLVLSHVYSRTNMECPDIYSGRAAYFRSEPSKIVREYPNVDLSLEKLCRGMMPNHTAMYINKSVFERVGLYSESFRIAGDFEFLFRFCSACSPTVQADSKIISLMQTGGASTGGIRSMITLNREMIKITRIYGFNLSIWKLLLKYLEKISELRVL